MNSLAARGRLLALWLSQAARISADNALRVFIALRLAELGAAEREYAWHLLSALLMLPAIVLAPLNGALANSLPKRWVLVGSAAFCFAIVLLFGELGGPWIAGWALLALGAAIYSPTRYALMPAAARDIGTSLTRVNGFIEMGSVCAIVAGMALGVHLERDPENWLGLHATVAAAIALNALAIVTAWPCHFRSDLRRPENANQAIGGFFLDAVRIWVDHQSRISLLGLSTLRALVTGATGAFFALQLSAADVPLLDRIESVFSLLVYLLAGAALGSLLAGWQRHPRRALGIVPLATTGLALGLMIAALSEPGPWLGLFLGMMGGLTNVPLAAALQLYVPPDARGNAMSIRNLVDYLFMAAISLALFALASTGLLGPAGQLWLVAALAALAAAVAWSFYLRESVELLTEWAILYFYRIRAHGAIDQFPVRGPVLVVANHAAWLDPLWLAKVLPRSLKPMMTSAFYDLPGMRWLMQNIFHAIRVQYSTFRREAPELEEAIQGLDDGHCVVIFPEGSLRKTEERPLRRFGQGVYHILHERPNTPVVVCWIEGNWKSFFSYFNGKPTKNKKMDVRRHIDIAVAEPILMTPEQLATHRDTRQFLETRCRQLRGVLGLPIPPADLAAESAEGEGEGG